MLKDSSTRLPTDVYAPTLVGVADEAKANRIRARLVQPIPAFATMSSSTAFPLTAGDLLDSTPTARRSMPRRRAPECEFGGSRFRAHSSRLTSAGR